MWNTDSLILNFTVSSDQRGQITYTLTASAPSGFQASALRRWIMGGANVEIRIYIQQIHIYFRLKMLVNIGWLQIHWLLYRSWSDHYERYKRSNKQLRKLLECRTKMGRCARIDQIISYTHAPAPPVLPYVVVCFLSLSEQQDNEMKTTKTFTIDE